MTLVVRVRPSQIPEGRPGPRKGVGYEGVNRPENGWGVLPGSTLGGTFGARWSNNRTKNLFYHLDRLSHIVRLERTVMQITENRFLLVLQDLYEKLA